jgi:putative ABC transport system substrate-binding protein
LRLKTGIRALLVGSDTLLNAQSDQLAGITARHDLPAIYPLRRFVEIGGFMSYEASLPDAFYFAGTFVARILKGERPAGLPVQPSTRFVLVVNRNTAKWLGINVPASILSRADNVIDYSLCENHLAGP